jgi:hypothetical protein
MERSPVRAGRPIRQTQVRPKLVAGLFPFFPAFLAFVLAFWFWHVAGITLLVVVSVFLLVLVLMWLATMHDAFWCEIGTQRVISFFRRVARTRGRSLRLRKYKAAR